MSFRKVTPVKKQNCKHDDKKKWNDHKRPEHKWTPPRRRPVGHQG
jgi:hypothetical protein